MKPVLLTGAAGFIGYHVAKRYLEEGRTVLGIDDLNDYYDVALKQSRLGQLTAHANFAFRTVDLADRAAIEDLFRTHAFGTVVHLGAQAGVRYSLENPHVYVKSNVEGFLHILEGCRHNPVEHLLYASSSSVYGAVTQMPFSVHQNVDHPISLYAATKKSNELFAHCYSHLYRIPCSGLRFFTVYGPWGRPDMALFLFTRAILAGEPIKVFGHGQMMRDFTYIDDVVEGIVRLAAKPAQDNPAWDPRAPDPGSSAAPYRVYNIGNHEPVQLLHLIEVLEACLGRKAIKEFLPFQPGDVPETYADTDDLAAATGYAPSTPIEIGVERFVRWYRAYYRV
ncbi:NAD-dependent epimerase [Methylobacterium mesophilicum SR1.6/6]|uniref:NAD-dependent epimerase n=1 Tax=Methylobacterium mesophilicum SR1.6/6 TaxID=908290 RepID=A0A6B9FNI1_9HYPH|nr:NAD-dependent epimerase [Methylobacterium mesophilicum]QGY02744.1 NAD-dependent epimerase [Methylobacterium mesophilicum SR1.6/6]